MPLPKSNPPLSSSNNQMLSTPNVHYSPAKQNGGKTETYSTAYYNKNGGKFEAFALGTNCSSTANTNSTSNGTEKSVRFGSSQYISTYGHEEPILGTIETAKPVITSNGDSKVKGILKTNLDANMMSLLLDSEDGTPVWKKALRTYTTIKTIKKNFL